MQKQNLFYYNDLIPSLRMLWCKNRPLIISSLKSSVDRQAYPTYTEINIWHCCSFPKSLENFSYYELFSQLLYFKYQNVWVKKNRFKLLQEMLIWNDYRNHLTDTIFLKRGDKVI